MKTASNNDEPRDRYGETIDCARSFFRDIKESHDKSSAKAISFSDAKNTWVYFGLWVLHPTRNLIAEKSTFAEQGGHYGGFTRINMGDSSLGDFSKKSSQTYKEGVSIRHRDTVLAQMDFNPTPNHFEAKTEIAPRVNFIEIKQNNQFRLCVTESNPVRQRGWGGYVDPVYKITNKQRELFLKTWEGLPRELATITKSNHSPSKYYTQGYYERILKAEKEREAEQIKRVLAGEPILEEWEPSPTKKSLYLMKDERTLAYKIGVSNSPLFREKTLASEKPSIKLVGAWADLSKFEKAWHIYFRRERIRGEWFSLTRAQVAFFALKCNKGQAPPVQGLAPRNTTQKAPFQPLALEP